MYRPLKSFLLKQETSYLRVSCYNKKLVIPDRGFLCFAACPFYASVRTSLFVLPRYISDIDRQVSHNVRMNYNILPECTVGGFALQSTVIQIA